MQTLRRITILRSGLEHNNIQDMEPVSQTLVVWAEMAEIQGDLELAEKLRVAIALNQPKAKSRPEGELEV